MNYPMNIDLNQVIRVGFYEGKAERCKKQYPKGTYLIEFTYRNGWFVFSYNSKEKAQKVMQMIQKEADDDFIAYNPHKKEIVALNRSHSAYGQPCKLFKIPTNLEVLR